MSKSVEYAYYGDQGTGNLDCYPGFQWDPDQKGWCPGS